VTASLSRVTLADLDARDPRRRLRAVPWAELCRLIDQQMWCWERDRRAGIASPHGRCGDGATDVVVRPDGVWVRALQGDGSGRSAGTLLLRERPGPFVAAPDTADDFGTGLLRHPDDTVGAAAALADVGALARWIADREQRVLSERGIDYRRGVVGTLHPSRHYCAPGGLAGCWRAWASLVE